MTHKIIVSFNPQDWELIEEIVESDLVKHVKSPEQALLWALHMGKKILDGMKAPSVWDTPGILPVEACAAPLEEYEAEASDIVPD